MYPLTIELYIMSPVHATICRPVLREIYRNPETIIVVGICRVTPIPYNTRRFMNIERK